MKKLVILVSFVFTTGCATMHRGADGEVTATYFGPSAHSAAVLASSTDSRAYNIVERAMNEDMTNVSLRRGVDGSVSFSAGRYQYGEYGWDAIGNSAQEGNVNHAAPDVVSIPGGWYTPSGEGVRLPILRNETASQVRAYGVDANESGIVECPKDRGPTNVAEQSACTKADLDALYDALEEE
jgi:hypothetical protein